MVKKSKKQLLGTAFFFGVLILTVWYVLRNENPAQILDYLQDAKLIYMVPAVFAVIAFILGESVILQYLFRHLGVKPRFFHCCLYSFIGFFYSAITPSASGGQPMQVVAMRHDGIPSGTSAVVLAIITILYKLVLVVLGIAVLVFRPASVILYLDEVEPLMYLGLGLNVVAIGLLLMVVFHPSALRRAVTLIFSLVNRVHPFRNPERILARLDATIRHYEGSADFFRNNPRIIIRVFFLTLLQRFCLFSVIWFTYLSFGLSGQSAIVVMLLYAMISVAADMLPLPGGMGISETLFLAIFETIFGEALVVPGMILARGVSYYTQLLISAVMTGISHFVFRERKQSKQE